MDFFEQLRAQKETWQPPVYPRVASDAWLVQFATADEGARVAIANAWAWRFNEEVMAMPRRERHDVVCATYRTRRALHPYVDTTLFSGTPYFTTIPNFLKSTEGISKEQVRDKFTNLLDIFWYGAQAERAKHLAVMASILAAAAKTDASSYPLIYDLTQKLVWDTLQELEQPTAIQLCAGVRVSMTCGRQHVAITRASNDPRAVAWHALALAVYQELGTCANTRGIDVLATIRAMPEITAADGIAHLIYQAVTGTGAKADTFVTRTVLGPNPTRVPSSPFEVLRHWIPSKKAVWDSAESLGFTYLDAVKQIMTSGNTTQQAPAVLPANISDLTP